MIHMLKASETYDQMLSTDKERFQGAARKLLNRCMLVRDKNVADRNDYVFLNDHFDMLEAFLDALGYSVIIDREAGVMRYFVPGETQTNIFRLTIQDKITLWCLFQLYNEKIEKSPLNSYVDVRFSDLIDLFEKYHLKERFGKSLAAKSIAVMKRFNIVFTNREELTPQSVIRILPSIRLCLDENELREYAKKGEALLKAEQDKAMREKRKAIRDAADEEAAYEEDEEEEDE